MSLHRVCHCLKLCLRGNSLGVTPEALEPIARILKFMSFYGIQLVLRHCINCQYITLQGDPLEALLGLKTNYNFNNISIIIPILEPKVSLDRVRQNINRFFRG